MQRALMTVLVLGTLGACADSGDEGMLLTRNVAPDGTSCSFTADPTEPFFSEGQWSILDPGGYLFHPQIQSRITALMGEELQRTIVVEGANIDLQVVDPDLAGFFDDSLTHFSTPFSAPLPPLGTADGEFQLIPHAFIDTLLANDTDLTSAQPPAFDMQIIATITVFGTMSGEQVTSQPFVYGVTLGNNIVVQDLGMCPLDIQSSDVAKGNACNPFQDGLITCCEQGGGLLCPATTMQ